MKTFTMSRMEKRIVDSLYELRDAINNDIRVKELKKAEDALSSSSEVIALSSELKTKESDYEMALKTHVDEEKAKKALYEAKCKLDDNPLVKSYNEAYIPVRDLYMAIDDVIFSPYRKKVLMGDK